MHVEMLFFTCCTPAIINYFLANIPQQPNRQGQTGGQTDGRTDRLSAVTILKTCAAKLQKYYY